MRDRRSVLLVEANSSELSSTTTLLESAGYRVVSATAFEEAKRLLAEEAPDLLITGLRLGPYNGLHLILRSRADHPEMAAIVTSRHHDAVLEAEAERQGARFITRPFTDSAFLNVVGASLEAAAKANKVGLKGDEQLSALSETAGIH